MHRCCTVNTAQILLKYLLGHGEADKFFECRNAISLSLIFPSVDAAKLYVASYL